MSTWLFIDKDGSEICSNATPFWDEDYKEWFCSEEGCDGNYWPSYTILPQGTIEKLIGYRLTKEDNPIILEEHEI